MTTTEKTNFQLFAEACRYDSGKSFLDSGDYYGRHYEKPPVAEDCNPVAVSVYTRGKDVDVTATIETAHFLDRNYQVDTELQRKFDEWQENREGNWFELAQQFCEKELGLHSQARDNTYNHECDLSQVYVWEVFTPEEKPSDWLYAEDSVVVIHIHTGCDVRGGYSAPLFCRSRGEYAVAVGHVAEFHVAKTHYEVEGGEYALDERWRSGWSSCPASEVSKDIERVFTHTVKGNTFIAKLKSGEVVRIAAEIPYVGW